MVTEITVSNRIRLQAKRLRAIFNMFSRVGFSDGRTLVLVSFNHSNATLGAARYGRRQALDIVVPCTPVWDFVGSRQRTSSNTATLSETERPSDPQKMAIHIQLLYNDIGKQAKSGATLRVSSTPRITIARLLYVRHLGEGGILLPNRARHWNFWAFQDHSSRVVHTGERKTAQKPPFFLGVATGTFHGVVRV